MRAVGRRLPLLASFLALVPPSTRAQAPAAPAPPATLSASERELVGTWSGRAKLTNEADAAPCLYDTPASPPGVTLEIASEGAGLKGTLRLAAPAPPGSACPALERSVALRELRASGSALSFEGPEGHAWTLARRGSQLLGTVAFQAAASDGEGLRLSGEVSLEKAGARRGSAFGAVAGVLGANVVAAGAFALANKAGKGQDDGPPQVTCSPRRCFLIAVGQCECNTTLTTGQPCGSTASGVGYAGACNVDGAEPCQAGLSCNAGFCEDRFGHCPF
jgi:hypothetical protein